MTRFRFLLWTVMIALCLGIGWAASSRDRVFAQAPSTETPATGVYITVLSNIGEPAINVRSGPSTAYYPIIGQLPVGATAPALGVSPGRAWIQISYPPGSPGVGWVYAAYVSLSPGYLPVVQPPPTPTPPATATFDPTWVAQFNVQPTPSRLPTFTPPAPLAVPTFSDLPRRSSQGFPLGILILALGAIGVSGLAISLTTRR